MNFRSSWKRCIAAVMLAGMAASGLTAYAAEAQPGTATLETAQPTVTATPETAAKDKPAAAAYAAQGRAAVATFALDEQSADDVDTQGTDTLIASIDFSDMRTGDSLPENWEAPNAAFATDPAGTGSALAISNTYTDAGLTYTLSGSYSTITVEEKVYLQKNLFPAGRFYLLELGDSSNSAYDLFIDNTDSWNQYQVHSGSNNNAENAAAVKTGQWTTITYTVDLQAQTSTVTIGENPAQTFPAKDSSITNPNYLKIYSNANSGGQAPDTIYLKSVTITGTPADNPTPVEPTKPDYTKGAESDDIAQGTFKPNNSYYYGSATFYDYYGDYERTGHPLSDLSNDVSTAVKQLTDADAYAADRSGNFFYNDQSAALWNTAVSEYFVKQSAAIDPLYFGGARYFRMGLGSNLIGKNALYNFTVQRTCGNGFSGASTPTKDGSSDAFYPNQGIAAENLAEDGSLLLNTTDGGTVPAPYFNKDFVRNGGSQAPNGQVYEDVAFPFEKDKNGVWLFDSTKDGAQLMQDRASGGYFIQDSDFPVTYASKPYFFPFNTAGQDVAENQAYKLNYMFGMKLELPFNLPVDYQRPEGGKNTVFRFAGDDDIWVYIDGQLVLDMGGSHGTVAGAIDFTNDVIMVSGKWNGQSGSPAAAMSNTLFWTSTENGITNNFKDEYGKYCTVNSLSETLGKKLTTGERHTIQIFYMERGWDQSNLKMSFNFNQSSSTTVTKQTDLTGLNADLFADVYDDVTTALRDIAFPFRVKNQRTVGKDDLPAYCGPLEEVPGKEYTHKTAAGSTPGKLDKDSSFTLKGGEKAIFTNQFDYDSYLQITEYPQDDRFAPEWSLTETSLTGQTVPVTWAQAGLGESNEPLLHVPGATPHDLREAAVPRDPKNEESLLLRPYGNAGEKVNLQLDFTNRLLVGTLTLRKQLADGTTPAKGSFTLLVQFTDVAGTGIAMPHPVEVVLNADNGYTATLTGIPYGTKYTVYEAKQDGWTLDSIQPGSAQGTLAGHDVYTLCYSGAVDKDAAAGEVIFRNRAVNAPTPSPTPSATPSATPTSPTATPTSPTAAPTSTPTAVPATPVPTQTPGAAVPITPSTTAQESATPTPAPTATPSAEAAQTVQTADKAADKATVQAASAIPQTEDTSHPVLLCLLCVASAFACGVVYAKWMLKQEP